MSVPAPLGGWFAARGWQLPPHPRAMLARAGEAATLLIAPTGGGKTLAGFLPTLAELGAAPPPGLHTLYVSPLKALTADIARNLRAPVEGAALAIRIEDRTGDTGATQRRRQRADPPHILLTTPESLAVLLAQEDAGLTFAGLSRVVVDEAHALAETKRGDQLALLIARLGTLAPGLRRVGLSATVEDPPALARWLGAGEAAGIVTADPGPAPDIAILPTALPPPWAGGGGRHAIPEVLAEIAAHRTTLVFHNTRAQAELFFRDLWAANADALPIAIHHGSLARETRARVESAMAAGELRGVVCTGSLDLGLDWGAVDLVVQVGAPKNVKRLVQRIGRANHTHAAPSKARLVPANRFEEIECVAALEAVAAHDLDGEGRSNGGLDVLCQHLLLTAAAGPFEAEALWSEVRRAGPYAGLARADFDACLDFVATGGYALRAYDRWQRLMLRDGRWRLRDPRAARVIRMNLGTIIDRGMTKVRLRGGAHLGEVEEEFAATLAPGDTFLIGGEVVRVEGLGEMALEVSRAPGREPRIAVYNGTKFATSTVLADRMLGLLADPAPLPPRPARWVARQAEVSHLPGRDRLLVESFPHEGREWLCLYGFSGRNAQQTLGLLVTKALEDAGLRPLGFVASDYATLIWGLDAPAEVAPLLRPEALRAGLDGWLAGNQVMKRAFRGVATISGLVERNQPAAARSPRARAFSTDIIHDTLRRYDPDHLLLRITRTEALSGLVDFGRVEEMLARVAGRIDLVRLDRPTPFAAPLLLEPGRVPVEGRGRADLARAGPRAGDRLRR
ncbi:MAG: ligase-associated DNA damage response DEXH box helicase, partial [Gemmobacter sp.]